MSFWGTGEADELLQWVGVSFPKLNRCHSIVSGEEPVQVAGVRVSHSGRNLLDAHTGIAQHVLHSSESVFGHIATEVFVEVTFEEVAGVGRRKLEFFGQQT